MIIIDGSKVKKYKKLDAFLERVYQSYQIEKETTQELQKRKEKRLDMILSNINIPAEVKEKYVNAVSSPVKVLPVSQGIEKQIKIISDGKTGFQTQDWIKNVKVETMHIKVADERIKKALKGEVDVTK